MSYILWLDNNKTEIAQITKHLGNDPRVNITFQETFVLGTAYLLQNTDKIKSFPKSSFFQIVCRGYYSSENKDALDLLPILNHFGLESVPVVVITADKAGVLKHFIPKAQSMGIQDLKSRVYVTDSSADLITKINANLIDNYAKVRRG
jgi:hypothetical protein